VVQGNLKIGMGHIYRSIHLSNHFINDNILFFTKKKNILGYNKLKSLNYNVVFYENKHELFKKLKEYDINIVINDILDTKKSYIKQLKNNNFFTVNFEDTGEGANYSDIVFNALYEWSKPSKKHFYGYKYEVLREDIFLYPISKKTNKKLSKVLITFGGVDINNATLKILKNLIKMQLSIKTTVILGIGYKYEKELYDYLEKIDSHNINVIKNISFMSDYINSHDLIISSNGRTVYEVVAMAKPIIVISQNEREMSHVFPKICSGITYAGYIHELDKNKFKKIILKYQSYKYRKLISKKLIGFAKEIRNGSKKVVSIINQKYYESC
jgi:spore coat polysaccharide biosynthesis predicted glycosyltransferase SpsG